MASRTILLLGALLAATSCGASDEPDAPATPSVLILSLDTTRADALSCYGGQGTSTPNLDRLAQEGTLYERAYTSAPLTLPAHASLMTGLYPVRHGIRNNGLGALSPEVDTLAEAARAAGYQTGAFLGSIVLSADFGLDQGFDVYDAPPPSGDGTEAERPAREVVDAALEWLDERKEGRPFLLFLHFYDPHTPYKPKDFVEGQIKRNYLGEVRDMDSEIGRLLDALRADGTLDETIVVAAGDHGEAFGEHRELGHSVFCYDTTLRVPLLIRWHAKKANRPAYQRFQELAGLVDIYPTLAAELGWEAPADVDGLGLGGDLSTRGLYFESYYGLLSFGWSPIVGWLDASGKYIHSSDPEFYHLPSDPIERANLMESQAAELGRYRQAINELAGRKSYAAVTGEIDRSVTEELQKLGYAGAGAAVTALPAPLEPSPHPSPASMQDLYEETLRAIQMTQRGELKEAAEVFERVLESNPDNPLVLDQLARCQVNLQQIEEAVVTLKRMTEIPTAPQANAWFMLGVCLRSLGKNDEAIAAQEKAAALDAQNPLILQALMSAYMDAGRDAEAARVGELLRRAQSQ